MSAVLEQRRAVTITRNTRFTRDEIHSVQDEIFRILDRLNIDDATGSITIHLNRGGICEIDLTQKS